MHAYEPTPGQALVDHRGDRAHRFMESADINAAFREVFQPLRANIRRGMSIEGELYAIEVDPCIPGELLDAAWLPLASYGIADHEELHEPLRRRAMFQRLLAEQRPEALFAYVSERTSASGRALLLVEIVSADGYYAAEHRVKPGNGWYARELVKATHRRLRPVARACAVPGQSESRESR